MSQRKFTSDGLAVLTGFNRRLRYFFLVVERQDCTVFSNLDLPNPAMQISQIQSVLTGLGVTAPPSLFTDLEEDRKGNIGNYIHDYGEV